MWCFTALDPVHPRCHWSSEEKDYGEMVNSLLDENKKLEDTEFFFWDHSFPFPMFFFQYSSPPVQKNHFNHKEFKKMYIHIYIYIYICFETIYLHLIYIGGSFPSHLKGCLSRCVTSTFLGVVNWEELLKLMACHLDNLASNYPGRDLVTWYTWQRLGDLMHWWLMRKINGQTSHNFYQLEWMNGKEWMNGMNGMNGMSGMNGMNSMNGMDKQMNDTLQQL